MGGSGFRSRIPFGLRLVAPFLGIFVVHFFHLLSHVGMLLHHVVGHGTDHFVPRFRRYFLIAFPTEFFACQSFHSSAPKTQNGLATNATTKSGESLVRRSDRKYEFCGIQVYVGASVRQGGASMIYAWAMTPAKTKSGQNYRYQYNSWNLKIIYVRLCKERL